ncbi:UNVERIFIED_CONTAM: hypothetical protein GTU68_031533, partial [Idotea baltica]|nr:hypothetical protein [Idotea baltica]
MKKKETQYVCSECGDSFGKWYGQCPTCKEWNTFKEFREAKLQSKGKELKTGTDLSSVDLGNDSLKNPNKIPSGIAEVDRVLENGFFPGSVLLFGGHPGIGKSTLAMQLFLQQKSALYFSGEESVHQVSNRASRLDGGGLVENIFSTNSLEDISATIQNQKPTFAVIDSIQMIGTENASMGNVQSIRENAEILVKVSKSVGTILLIIGHVTKNDEIAGPKVLEHLVDVVLYLEGERETGLRILRTSKNRFGSTMEVGIFTMDTVGLTAVHEPSEFFLSERPEHASGACITVIREGSR